MNPFEMVVLIVAIVMAASVFRAKFGRDAATGAAPRDDLATRDDTMQLQAEIRALKQRVATLERIATDGATALDREIEALRDRS